MKKFAIASMLAVAALSASAVELGVTATRDYAGENRNFGGVTLGQHYGAVGLTAGIERANTGNNDQNRYSLVAGYDVAKVGVFTITPKVGVAYLDNQTGSDGYAMTVGAGVSVPVAQKVTLGLDVARQYGQDRVSQFDGNRVTVSAKYSF